MNNYKELNVWQKSVDLAVNIHTITQSFPTTEIYSLTNQIRRATFSISSNIAEGSGRKTNKDFSHFLGIALGSSFELETQLIIAYRINYLNIDSFDKLSLQISEIQKMIRGLQKSLTN